MSWRCTVCKRPRGVGDAAPPLMPSLTKKYLAGKCVKCRTRRFFEEFEPEVWRGAMEPRAPLPPGVESAGPQNLTMGEKLRERGMSIAEQSEEMTVSGWNERADGAIRALALLRLPFTSEDVTKRVGLPSRSSGAVGARMNAAAKRGIIRWTGQMAQAQRPNQHSALLKVWRGHG